MPRGLADQAPAGVDCLDVLVRARQLRARVEGEARDAKSRALRLSDEADRRVGVAAELAREVNDRVGVAEGDAQQEAHPLAAGDELRDLLCVIHDEGRDAAVERVTYVGSALDRVRVHAARRRNAGIAHEVHLPVRGEVEP
jgi:hypothetical protein